MNGERDKILAMVEEGSISAAEANELLEAIDEAEERDRGAAPEFTWPEMPQRGQAWRRPFNLALLGAVVGSSLLLTTRNSSGLLRFVHRFLFWPLTLFAAAAALVTYFTKDSPWLHIRVKSGASEEFAISVPFPADALQKALHVARAQAPNPEVREKIDAAAEILAQMDTSNLKDPLVIDISDEGDSVQVYLN